MKTQHKIPRDFTYDKGLGIINKKKRHPLVEAGGEYWFTFNNTIVLVPDQWATGGVYKTLEFGYIPKGTQVVQAPVYRNPKYVTLD